MFLNIWHNWQKPIYRPHKPDYRLLLVALVLLLLGALTQFILGPALIANRVGEVSVNYYFWRHLIAIIVGLAALYGGYKIHIKYWLKYSPHILVAGIFVGLLAVFSGGVTDVRWLQFQGFSLQPAEILKLGFILVAAGYLYKARNVRHKTFLAVFKANYMLVIIVAILGILILILQRDYGSMFVIVMAGLAMFWMSGVSSKILWVILLAVALIGIFFIAIEPHRRERLSVFLNPTADCQDAGYQICQALIGVGSGGLTGRGFGGSVQVYGYLPEANNDSIFAIYAEIAGFLGTLILISLLVYLLYVNYKIASRLEDPLMLIAVGFLCWIGVQSFINIAGILNIIPLKGITLPLISFGGSSLVFILLMIGILLQISAYTINNDKRRSYQSGLRRRGDGRSRHTSRRARR